MYVPVCIAKKKLSPPVMCDKLTKRIDNVGSTGTLVTNSIQTCLIIIKYSIWTLDIWYLDTDVHSCVVFTKEVLVSILIRWHFWRVVLHSNTMYKIEVAVKKKKRIKLKKNVYIFWENIFFVLNFEFLKCYDLWKLFFLRITKIYKTRVNKKKNHPVQ